MPEQLRWQQRVSDPALDQLASVQPVRSLRQSTRAAALRSGRACYDHLAGQLGVGLTKALVGAQALRPTDGIPDNRRRDGDQLSSQLGDHPYVLGPAAAEVFSAFLAAGWITRAPGQRAVVLTTAGRDALSTRLGLDR